MNFYTQATILAYGSVILLLGIIAYDLYAKRRDAAVNVRRKALTEAAEALQSLAYVAADACETRRRDGLPHEVSAQRAYYLQRATEIVRSIPVDRL